MSSRRIRMALALAAVVLSGRLPAATAWFSGGSYDGYETASDLGAMDLPQVNNAGGATGVTAVSAWLNGTLLESGGAPAEVYVFWGPADGETNRQAWAHGTNFGFVAEWALLSTNVSLSPNSTCHYRFYATNTLGEEGWAAASAAFDVPGPPGVTAGMGALPVGRTTATLNGALTAGDSAAVSIHWGLDGQAWSHTNTFGELGQGAFRLRLDGLVPGTAYAYQVYATNGYGEHATAPVPFATVADLAWSGGGSYDGFDRNTIEDSLRSVAGTVFIFR